MEDLCSMTLWLTVWDTRQLGHNMFLGEVRIQLDSIQITTLKPMWWQLQHLVRDVQTFLSGTLLIVCGIVLDTKLNYHTSKFREFRQIV